MKVIRFPKQHKGLSLIELMIALVLGLLITAGVIQVFVANKQTYRVTDAHSRLQDNARFALEILSRDIRSAGYSGCRVTEKMNVTQIANAPIPTEMTENTMITGIEADSATTWNTGVPVALGAVIGGTDIISMQHGTSCGGTLTANLGDTDGDISVATTNTCNLSSGDILMVADCEDAHIFRASVGTTTQSVKHDISENQAKHFCKSYTTLPSSAACATGEGKIYNFDSELLKFSALTYFIRLGVNGEPALWAYDQTSATGPSNPSELIEGIENLQVLYGADDNDDNIVDRYVTAKVINDSTDWNKVISTQISLLAQTLDTNLITSSQNINFNGSTVISSEGRLRRVFSSTVAIRNRLQ